MRTILALAASAGQNAHSGTVMVTCRAKPVPEPSHYPSSPVWTAARDLRLRDTARMSLRGVRDGQT
jgi:hypothetical protein